MRFYKNVYIVLQFRLQSNITGLSSDNRWTTKTINKIFNRLIEIATPRIFDLNQKLFNYAINNIIVPRINKILTMYTVLKPSIKLSDSKNDDSILLMELDDATIVKYMKEHPITYPDEARVIGMLLSDKISNKK